MPKIEHGQKLRAITISLFDKMYHIYYPKPLLPNINSYIKFEKKSVEKY